MSDVFTKAKRSEVMSRIRSRGNKATELALARLLRANGITGWRRQVQVRIAEFGVRSSSRGNEAQTESRELIRASSRRLLRVKVDFVFPKLKLAVFVDGCFWHGCPRHGTQPKGNASFWRRKFSANKRRDALVNRALRRAGWRVVRIWEHELKKYGVRPSSQRFDEARIAECGMPAFMRRIQRVLG